MTTLFPGLVSPAIHEAVPAAHAPHLEQLRADALSKIRPAYGRARVADAALVKVSRYLDWLLRYPVDTCGWALDVLMLVRIPLVYDVAPERPRANHLLMDSFVWRGAPRHLFALPDWSLALRSRAKEKPQGARVAALPQLPLFEDAA